MKYQYFITLLALAMVSCEGSTDKTPEATDNKIQRAEAVNYVDTIHIRESVFRSELVSNGKLRARKKSDLKFSVAGIVDVLNVKNGSKIGQGAVIASVESGEAALRLKQAQSRFEKAKIDLADALLGFGYTSGDTTNVKPGHLQTAKIRSGYDAAADDIVSARMALDKCKLQSPFEGKIANLKTKLHENPKGDFFCTVIDDSSFDIEFAVLESELKNIREGQQVKVTTFVEPQKKYTGTINSINLMVDEKGQILVAANITNPGGLIDGMNVKVYVENDVPNKLVVPKSAVLIRDNLEVLFRMTPQGKTIWTYVLIEAANSDSYAVIANADRGADLSAGDAVIIGGNLNLADNVDVEAKQ